MKKQNFILFFALLAIVGLFAASPAFAQAGASQGPCSSTDKLGECIVRIYRWSLGLAVLLALIMIIFAGYKYITAGGNAQSVASAKEMFAGAFIGLIILFAAVIILRTINPNLVLFNGNFTPGSGGNQPAGQQNSPANNNQPSSNTPSGNTPSGTPTAISPSDLTSIMASAGCTSTGGGWACGNGSLLPANQSEADALRQALLVNGIDIYSGGYTVYKALQTGSLPSAIQSKIFTISGQSLTYLLAK